MIPKAGLVPYVKIDNGNYYDLNNNLIKPQADRGEKSFIKNNNLLFTSLKSINLDSVNSKHVDFYSNYLYDMVSQAGVVYEANPHNISFADSQVYDYGWENEDFIENTINRLKSDNPGVGHTLSKARGYFKPLGTIMYISLEEAASDMLHKGGADGDFILQRQYDTLSAFERYEEAADLKGYVDPIKNVKN